MISLSAKSKNFIRILRKSIISAMPLIAFFLAIFLSSNIFKIFVNSKSEPIISKENFFAFIACSISLAFGSALFQFGCETSIKNIGLILGKQVSKFKSILNIALISVLLGILITVAEPDLSIFGKFFNNEKRYFNFLTGEWLIRITAGVGVGIFLLIGVLRILLFKNFKQIVYASYILIFLIACFFGPDKGDPFIRISYDISGVTTGPATVPFIMSYAISIAATQGGDKTTNDSFGMIGIMSIGPILTMLILLINTDLNLIPKDIEKDFNILDMLKYVFYKELINSGYSLFPLMLFFLAYNFFFLKVNNNVLKEILIGFLITFVGLYLFLLSAMLGFRPVSFELGKNIASNESIHYLFFIFSGFMGFAIILTEPAVKILYTQLGSTSNKIINKNLLFLFLSIGVSAAITIQFANNLFWKQSSYFFILGICTVILVLMLFVSDSCCGLAFDSGGISTGTISTCLILPIFIGLNWQQKDTAAKDQFGVIGMISLMPILSVQVIGIMSKIRENWLLNRRPKIAINNELTIESQIINFE